MQAFIRWFSLGFIMVVLILSISNLSFQPAGAQQASLSVFADAGNKFFGPQIVEIIVDSPGLRDPDTSAAGLIVNGVNVPLVHLTDSGWYAFVANRNTFSTLAAAANLPGTEISASGGSFWSLGPNGKSLFFPSLPNAFGNDPSKQSLNPNLDLNGDCPAAVTDQNQCVEWPYIRLFSFSENDQVSFRYADQSVTLTYSKPSLNDVSISLDRQSYPVGAEIILTLVDYMWKINPVEENRVHFAFSGSDTEVFYQASTALTPAEITGSLNSMGFDAKQILKADGIDGIKFANKINGMPETVLKETSPRSGVFENFDINADMFANKRDAQIRFDYFDKSTSSGMATGDGSLSVGKEEPRAGTSAPKAKAKVETPQVKIAPYFMGEPRLVDLSGRIVDKLAANQPVLVQTKITNNLKEEQPLIYILQVKDSNGFTAMLTWIKSTVNASSSLDSGISWIPEESGNYKLELFVWKSLSDPGAALMKSMTISVEG